MSKKTKGSTPKLVSILTPCYNADKFIYRLLDSVIEQDYKNIEMIVVDDGSTDKSKEIIKSYIPKFKKRGYELKYLYQENQGQSAAINNGLKIVRGDYLLWPDADDFYTNSTSIEKMVDRLDGTGDDIGAVRVQYNVLNDALKLLGHFEVDDTTRYKTDLFEDYLFNAINSTWVIPGGYMIKMNIFDQEVKNREIYTEKEAGQNYQIMLPILYRSKCLTIHEYLYSVVRHSSSHSRTPRRRVMLRQVYRRAAIHTLNKLSIDKDYKKYLIKKYDLRKPPMILPVPKWRRLTKKLIKGAMPYGVMVIYRRSR